MSWEIRPITPDELPAFIRVDGAAYSSPQTDEDIEAARGSVRVRPQSRRRRGWTLYRRCWRDVV